MRATCRLMHNSRMRICVYCASSEHVDRRYHDAAALLGRTLAQAGCTLVYGGGGAGLMGTLASAALDAGGEVIGVIPRFMIEVEWQHPGVANLEVVEDMRERKHRLLTGSDAVVALPGGCGTLEELFEAITWKRLGLYFGPVVLVNVGGFFDPCIELLNRCVDERFMDEKHRAMWSVAGDPEGVMEVLRSAAEWSRNARDFAALR